MINQNIHYWDKQYNYQKYYQYKIYENTNKKQLKLQNKYMNIIK